MPFDPPDVIYDRVRSMLRTSSIKFVTFGLFAAISITTSFGCHRNEAAPAGEAAALQVGKPAPSFSVTAHDGTSLSSESLKGHPVVVYFYPKDETPGCTKEACAFRDAWEKLSSLGVVLIGVSNDSNDSHKQFAEHHQLPFHLVSDSLGTLAIQFGVPNTRGFLARQSFVIGKDGNVKKIYRSVDVASHAQEILADVQ